MQPLFILCPLRSFSSITCGIIGQHPQTYGLPEVNLTGGDTLAAALRQALQRGQHAQAGILRTIAQLHDGAQTAETVAAARAWVDLHGHWPVRAVFEHIQECVGERILVDKSPATVMKPEFLERLHATFPDAHYLHLTRHPVTTGSSILTLLERRAAEGEGRYSPDRVNPERIWLTSHSLIRDFTNRLPEGQCMRIRGEDMLRDLDLYLPQICEWLDIRDDAEAIAAMLRPEDSPYACLGPDGAQYGNDPNFLENPSLDRERLAKMREPRLDDAPAWMRGRDFSPLTRKLCREFGYR